MNKNLELAMDSIIKFNNAYNILLGGSKEECEEFENAVKTFFKYRQQPVDLENIESFVNANTDFSKNCLKLIAGIFNIAVDDSEDSFKDYFEQISEARSFVVNAIGRLQDLPIEPNAKRDLSYNKIIINFLFYNIQNLGARVSEKIFNNDELYIEDTLKGFVISKCLDEIFSHLSNELDEVSLFFTFSVLLQQIKEQLPKPEEKLKAEYEFLSLNFGQDNEKDQDIFFSEYKKLINNGFKLYNELQELNEDDEIAEYFNQVGENITNPGKSILTDMFINVLHDMDTLSINGLWQEFKDKLEKVENNEIQITYMGESEMQSNQAMTAGETHESDANESAISSLFGMDILGSFAGESTSLSGDNGDSFEEGKEE